MAKSIVHVPFVHRVLGIAKGDKKEKWHDVWEDAPVEIPHFSSDEVPVGFQVRARDGSEASFRVREGRPLRPLYGPNDRDGRPREPLDLIGFELAISRIERSSEPMHWKGYPFPVARGPSGRIEPRSPVRFFRSVSVDRRADAMETVSAVARHLCLVDGVVHHEVPEPIWGVWSHELLPHGPRVGIRLHDERTSGDLSWFRGDRLEDARLMASHLQREGSDVEDGFEVEDFGLIDWRFDDVMRTLQWVALSTGVAIKTCEEVTNFPLDVFVAFCGLRDVLSSVSPDRAAALTHVEMLAAVLDGLDGRRFPSLSGEAGSEVRSALWRLREIDGLLAAHEQDDALTGFKL